MSRGPPRRASRPEHGDGRHGGSPGSVVLLVLLLLLVGAAASPLAHAHDAHQNEGMDDQLIEAGNEVLVGGFDAPQTGPLVVVPLRDGPLPCGAMAAGYALPLGDGVAVSFVANATHVQAEFDLPAGWTGYAGAAVDTNTAVRSLMMMIEHAVAIHMVGAHVVTPAGNQTEAVFLSGLMGVPYILPGAVEKTIHGPVLIQHPMEGGGIRMDYRGLGPVAPCGNATQGHMGVRFDRFVPSPEDQPWRDPKPRDALRPGVIVHAVVLVDGEVPHALPRPTPTTKVLQLNLYLTRPGEDPAAVRAALERGLRTDHAVPLVALAAGLLWVARRRG